MGVKATGGIYITLTATQEFVEQKLTGLGFNSWIIESHQQLIERPPPPKKQVWSLSSRPQNADGYYVYVAQKPIPNDGPNWKRIDGHIQQLSTGHKEMYGIHGKNTIVARATTPGAKNAAGGTGWRVIPGGLTNISASNKDYVFGVNRYGNIYQCKKPCTGGWQKMEGGLRQVSAGQKYLYGVNSGDYIYRARLPITNLRNPQWNNIPGRLKWINASNKDYIYGTNSSDDIYVCKKPCSGNWAQISGKLDKIEADATKVYGTNSAATIYSKPMDGMSAEPYWSRWTVGGGSANVSPEPFIGGMKEGYAPLENDMIQQCEKAGTQGGGGVPGVAPTGNFLVENRKKEKAAFAKLQSMQTQVKNSINQMQGDNLHVNALYKTKNTDLLKKLASYEQASHKLLKTGANLDTLSAQQSDSLLRKNSVDMSYYLWLTLAISILGIAITKIK